jgi:GT2 family glycosyltransferase
MYQVATILINYNSSHYTLNAVKSIIDKTSKKIDYQIIVVDNASQYEDYLRLKDRLPHVKNLTLFRSRINTGFGGGNMLGIQFANAKYYAFINNDTLLKNDCLSLLYNFLEENESIGICAPQGFDENDEVVKSFDHFLTLRKELFGRKLLERLNPRKYPKRKKIYYKPIKVQCVPGSFLFVNADSFNKVGGFDTNIFLYYEETDLAFRIKQLETKNTCYLMPLAQYTHFEGKSTDKSLRIKKELKLSMLYVLNKNSGYLSFLIIKNIMIIKYVFKSFYKPSYFSLVSLLFIKGGSIIQSLKQSQKILIK